MAQFGRPSADTINVGPFTGVGATSPNLWQALDEVVQNDNDWVESPSNPAGTEQYGTLLSAVSDPVSSTGHIVRYRYSKSASSGRTINLTIRLFQGDTEIASWTHNGISNVVTAATQTLTGTQADSITDYSDLRIRFDPISSGGGAGRTARLHWVELEVPTAPPPEGRSADVAVAVSAPTAASSASLGFTGNISASVPSPTTGLSANESFAADISATVQSPTTSADASWLLLSFTGDVSATISPPVSSASAVHTPQYAGDITASVPAPSSSASASQSFAAVINAAVLSPVSAASALSSGPYVATVASSVPPPTTALSADNTDPFVANIITSVIAPVSSLIASTAEPILGHVRAHHGRMFALNTSVIRMSESTSALRGGIDVGHTVLTIEEDHG